MRPATEMPAPEMPAPDLPTEAHVAARNVMFLIRSLEHGGAERQLCLLASGLRARGWRVKVISYYSGGALRSELEQAGVPVLSLEKRGRWDLVRPAVRLLRLVSKERPGIFYTYLTTANLLGVLLKPWLQEGSLLWGIRTSDRELGAEDWLARVSARVEEWLARRADWIVSNSAAGKQACIARGFPPERMTIVPNGIDTERFRFDPSGRRRVRAQWRVPDDGLVIGLVARRAPKKDHHTFLRAAALLRARLPGCRFVCIGGGPDGDAQRLRRATEELRLADVVIWDEGRDDMAAVYSGFDVACSSSCFGEGFSNAIAEAMACERACVVTAVGDSERIVGDCGKAVPPRDPVALALAIASLATLTAVMRGDLGRRARARVEAKFSVDALIRRTLEVFERATDLERGTQYVKRASAAVDSWNSE